MAPTTDAVAKAATKGPGLTLPAEGGVMDERSGDETTEKLPQSRAPIFFRPPDNWNEMTDEEKNEW